MEFREIRTPEKVYEDVRSALERGQYTQGVYPFKVEERMKEITKAQQAIAVSSGTMGLKIALDTLGVKPGDFVVVPDITFIVCATVIHELGAIPLFVDVDPVTMLLDEKSMVKNMAIHGDKVKAIMAVRLGGNEIPDWVYGFNVPVLIDSAHSMDPLPEKAVAAVYSFHPSKIVSGLDGGCIVTNSAGDAERMRRLRVFGFAEGTRIAVEVGYKAYMTNVSAIVIWHNLMDVEKNLANRRHVRDRYNKQLGLDWQGLGMYMVLSANADLLCERIPAIRHYPMTLSEMTTGVAQNVQAAGIVKCLVSIPMHEWLTDSDVDMVCATIKST